MQTFHIFSKYKIKKLSISYFEFRMKLIDMKNIIEFTSLVIALFLVLLYYTYVYISINVHKTFEFSV